MINVCSWTYADSLKYSSNIKFRQEIFLQWCWSVKHHEIFWQAIKIWYIDTVHFTPTLDVLFYLSCLGLFTKWLCLGLQLKFEEDLKITRMYSAEGEDVAFMETLYPTGNVEDWMLEIERCMKESLRIIIRDSLKDYKEVYVLFI